MTFLLIFVDTLRWHVRKVIADVFIDVIDCLLMQTVLVALESQNKVAAARDNLVGDGRLSSHGVDRDDGTIEIHKSQHFRNGCDFIGLCLGRDLRQRQSKIRQPGTDQVHRPETFGSIVTALHCLAINRHMRFCIIIDTGIGFGGVAK